jgi:uncharacterized protein (DUF58 family)
MRIGGWIPGAAGARAEEPLDPFDPLLLSRLDRARLVVGGASGERPGETPVRGRSQESGVELESYKTYSPGDDIRHLDWMALGRTNQLLTRRFVAEREITVHILLDTSASMGAPRVDGKLAFAIRAAVALAYVALTNNDSVRLAELHGDGVEARIAETRLFRHRGRFGELRPFVGGLAPSGSSPLSAGIRAYLERHRERGLAFVISDFLAEPDEIERALLALRSRKLEVRAIHVLGREERELATLRGRLRLRDVESGGSREVVLGDADRRRYREAFDARVEALRRWCLRHGVGYVGAHVAENVEELLVRRMAAAGMVRYR